MILLGWISSGAASRELLEVRLNVTDDILAFVRVNELELSHEGVAIPLRGLWGTVSRKNLLDELIHPVRV